MINLIKWKNMKNYIVYFILLLTLVLTGACNNEWVEEVYVQNVGLKAPDLSATGDCRWLYYE